jgi:hypothetical protein
MLLLLTELKRPSFRNDEDCDITRSQPTHQQCVQVVAASDGRNRFIQTSSWWPLHVNKNTL